MDVKMREITKQYQNLNKNTKTFEPTLLDKLNKLKQIKR